MSSLYNVSVPLWEAPEEPHHFDYVRHLAEEHKPGVPVAYGRAPGGNKGLEFTQPPLYYAISAVLTGWIKVAEGVDWHRNPYFTWPEHPAARAFATHFEDEAFPYSGLALAAHAARLVSSLMGAATVLCTYLLALVLVRSKPLAVAAAGLNAVTPGFLFSSSTVNNDNGVTLFSSLLLLASVRLITKKSIRWHHALGYGLLVAFAALSKLNGLLLLPVVLAVVIVAGIQGKLSLVSKENRSNPGIVSNTLCFLAIAFGISFVLFGSWWYFLISPYADIIGRHTGAGFIDLRAFVHNFSWGGLLNGFRNLFISYWGSFGWSMDILPPSWAYWLIGVVCLLSLTGLIRFFLAPSGFSALAKEQRMGFGISILALIIVVSAAIMRQISVGYEAWSRVIFPVVSVSSLLMVLGLNKLGRQSPKVARGDSCRPTRRGELLASSVIWAWIAGLLVLSVVAPGLFIKPSYVAPVPAFTQFDVGKLAATKSITFTNGMKLLGYDGELGTKNPGDRIDLALYWKAETGIKNDYIIFVHLMDPRGERISQIDAIPLEEQFPPRQWEEGLVIRQSISLLIPDDAIPGRHRLEVGMYTDPEKCTELVPITEPAPDLPAQAGLPLGKFVLAEVEIVRPSVQTR